jgi:hypothetical protein
MNEAPLIIDMKCGCGAHFVVECKAFSVFVSAETLLRLAAAWTSAHGGCSKSLPTPPTRGP